MNTKIRTIRASSVELMTAQWDAPANVVACTTLRTGGHSTGEFAEFNLADHVGDDPGFVSRNRILLRDRLGEQVDFQWLEQVHGIDTVTAGRGGQICRGDAVFTNETGLACCVLTADCLPILLASRQGDAVAAVHAGWRGLAAGVLEEAIAKFSVPPDQLLAWLGPAIGPCHFQVGADVRDAFLAAAPEALKLQIERCFITDSEAGKYRADLYRLAAVRLTNLGVLVSGGGFCTYCDTDRFYSYRRQPITGRMASLIYLKP